MKICVIPARGGSKRIPKKNIRNFSGKPIISYSIGAALESACFDRVIVSTDDSEVAVIAEKYGAEVPFARPQKLADDYTGTVPVIKHAIEWLHSKECMCELVCCLYPTAPLVCAVDLKNGLELVRRDECDYAFPVTTYDYPVQRAIKIGSDKRVEMFDPHLYLTRSQDLDEVYHDAGQFYWGKVEAWLNEIPIFSSRSCPIIIPRYRAQDIDTEEDWKLAELIYRNIENRDV